MKFSKLISTLFHPIVLPTIGSMLYFLLIQNNFRSNQKFAVLGMVFLTTYIIPICILLLFKKLQLISSYKTESISERKIPVLIMILVFYLLGNTLEAIPSLEDLSILFYATSIGLITVYLLFVVKIKISIHVLSMAILVGYFMVLTSLYNQSFIPVIIITILLAGVLGSARLQLNAHTPKEVYLGFLFGFLSPIITTYIL